jgi:methylated-DNA-[protein]-cysteine S-methyltransferase
MLRYRVFHTSRGAMGFVTGPRGLRRVYLPEANAGTIEQQVHTDFPGAASDSDLLPGLVAQFQAYLAGEPVTFNAPLDLARYNNFDVDAWRACQEAAYGQTQSYKQIAERIGRPGGARAVGLAMSRNPFPIVVPCHRVLKSDGGLGGYSGPGGIVFKQELLELEHRAATASA